MPRTDYDEVYEKGVLISSTPRVVSDAEIEMTAAHQRILDAIAEVDALLAKPKTSWTSTDVRNAAHLSLRIHRAMIRKLLRR